MPFVFLIIGLLLLVVAIQGTQGQAFALLKGEFTGSNSFVVFASAIAILGALAFIRPIRPIAMGMIGLVILGMILANKGGFFSQLNNALRNPVAPSSSGSAGLSTLATQYQQPIVTGPTSSNPFGLGSGTLNPWIAPETLPATP
jgi:hypothetical protein